MFPELSETQYIVIKYSLSNSLFDSLLTDERADEPADGQAEMRQLSRSPWSDWGDCDAQCGGGEKKRPNATQLNFFIV